MGPSRLGRGGPELNVLRREEGGRDTERPGDTGSGDGETRLRAKHHLQPPGAGGDARRPCQSRACPDLDLRLTPRAAEERLLFFQEPQVVVSHGK